VGEYREAIFDEVPTHDPLGSLPLLLLEDSSNGSQHASMDHASSHHHARPLLDDSSSVLINSSPSQYDVGPHSTYTSTPTISGQTHMANVDLIDDSSNLPIENVSSLFQDTLVNSSSNPHIANDNSLVSSSSNPHVTDAPNTLTPLLCDDENTLHDSLALVTLLSNRSRSTPKWVISTLVEAIEYHLLYTRSIVEANLVKLDMKTQ
jgi:hypothetical protein